ncbi:Putative DUF3857 domain-containing protein [Candidatus Trichorickettsia mobilis]|uniref:DUF3857 domain-containing protein n=1 Tax=Candidatus Trichorickettsia mobilis TaxID=1346319 RepID=A0ABZ0UU40_9RICK|nr:hypothetical protein [Candidatus Trichorickettsia mobilis]WPY01326.1 Putative DUF3857 domain-containing protein [Candidatus Trichorickettsia mobilis]
MNYLINFILHIFILIVLGYAGVTYARLQDLKNTPIQYDFYNTTLSIKEDGTYEELIEIQVRILNESGRKLMSKYAITYDGDSSLVNIIKAKTLVNKYEYEVSQTNIEDKYVANNLSEL